MSHLVDVNVLLRTILDDDSKALTSLLELGNIDPFLNRVLLGIEPSDENGGDYKSIFDFAMKKGKNKCVFSMLMSHGYRAPDHALALYGVVPTVSEDVFTFLSEDAGIHACTPALGQSLLFFPGKALHCLLGMPPLYLSLLAPLALQVHEETGLPPLFHYLTQTHPSFIDLSVVDRLVVLQEHACSSWLIACSRSDVVGPLHSLAGTNVATEASKYADALNTHPERHCGVCRVEQHLHTLEDALQYACSRSMWPVALRLAQAHLQARPLRELALGADVGVGVGRSGRLNADCKDTSPMQTHTCSHPPSQRSHPHAKAPAQQQHPRTQPQFDSTAALRSLVLLGPTPTATVSRYAHLVERAAWEAVEAKAAAWEATEAEGVAWEAAKACVGGEGAVIARAMGGEVEATGEVEVGTSFESATGRKGRQARERSEEAANGLRGRDRDRKPATSLPFCHCIGHQHDGIRPESGNSVSAGIGGDGNDSHRQETATGQGRGVAPVRRVRCGGLGCWGGDGPLLPSASVCAQSLLWWSSRLPQPRAPLLSPSQQPLFPSPRCALAAALIAMGADATSSAGPTSDAATRASGLHGGEWGANSHASNALTATNGSSGRAAATLGQRGRASAGGDSLIMRAAAQRDWEVLCGAASALRLPARVELCTCTPCPCARGAPPLSLSACLGRWGSEGKGSVDASGVRADEDADVGENSRNREQLRASKGAGLCADTVSASGGEIVGHVPGATRRSARVGCDGDGAQTDTCTRTSGVAALAACPSILAGNAEVAPGTHTAVDVDVDADVEWVCLDPFHGTSSSPSHLRPHAPAHDDALPQPPSALALGRAPLLLWPVRPCAWQWSEELTSSGTSVADAWAAARNLPSVRDRSRSRILRGEYGAARGRREREGAMAVGEMMSGGAGVLFEATSDGHDGQGRDSADGMVQRDRHEGATGHARGPVGGCCGVDGVQCGDVRNGACPVGERVFSPWTCGAVAAVDSSAGGDGPGHLQPVWRNGHGAAAEGMRREKIHVFAHTRPAVGFPLPPDADVSPLRTPPPGDAGITPSVSTSPLVHASTPESIDASLSRAYRGHAEAEVVLGIRGRVVFPDAPLPMRGCACCGWPLADIDGDGDYAKPLLVSARKYPRVVLERDPGQVARERDSSYPAESGGGSRAHDCGMTSNATSILVATSHISAPHETRRRGNTGSHWLRYADQEGLPLLGEVDCAAVREWECSLLYANKPNTVCTCLHTVAQAASRCLRPRHVAQLLATIASPLNVDSILQLARRGHWGHVCALLQGGGLGEAQLQTLLGLQWNEVGPTNTATTTGKVSRAGQDAPLPSLLPLLVRSGAVALWLQVMRAVVDVAAAQATTGSSPSSVSAPQPSPHAPPPFIAAPPVRSSLSPALLAAIAKCLIVHPCPGLFRLQDALMQECALVWTALPHPGMQNPELYFPEMYDQYFLETRGSSRDEASRDTGSLSTNGGLALLHSGLTAALAIITAQCIRCGPKRAPQGAAMPPNSLPEVADTGLSATFGDSPALAEGLYPTGRPTEAPAMSDTDRPSSKISHTLPPLPAALLPSVALCNACALTLAAFASPLLLPAAAATSPRALQLLRGYGADALYACTDDSLPSFLQVHANAQAPVELSAPQRLLLRPPGTGRRAGRTALAELFHACESSYAAMSASLQALIAPVEVVDGGTSPVPTAASAGDAVACGGSPTRVSAHPPLALPAPCSVDVFVDVAEVLVRVLSGSSPRTALELLLAHGLRVDTPLFRAHAISVPILPLREVFGLSAVPAPAGPPPRACMRLLPVQPPLLAGTVWTMPMLCVRAGQDWLLRVLLEQHAATGRPIRQSEPQGLQRSFYTMEDTKEVPEES